MSHRAFAPATLLLAAAVASGATASAAAPAAANAPSATQPGVSVGWVPDTRYPWPPTSAWPGR